MCARDAEGKNWANSYLSLRGGALCVYSWSIVDVWYETTSSFPSHDDKNHFAFSEDAFITVECLLFLFLLVHSPNSKSFNAFFLRKLWCRLCILWWFQRKQAFKPNSAHILSFIFPRKVPIKIPACIWCACMTNTMAIHILNAHNGFYFSFGVSVAWLTSIIDCKYC